MIQIENALVSRDVLDKQFVCDLNACKGACCVEGDAGAPLTDEEVDILESVFPIVKPFMRKEGIEAVESQGTSTTDSFDGEKVTPLVNNEECAYVVFSEDGKALCAIEQAQREGKIEFKKPISCHLYPIRIKKYKTFEAVNYDKWDICEPACECGTKLQVPVYRFAKESLIRYFGEEWFDALDAAGKHLGNPSQK